MNKNIIYIIVAVVSAIAIYFLVSPYERCLRSYENATNPEVICGKALKGGL